jgi:hypothetical protein
MNCTGSQLDVGLSMYATTRKAIGALSCDLSARFWIALLVFQGCNGLNPLCGSARPSTDHWVSF